MGSAFSEIPELVAQTLKVGGIVTMLFFVSPAATLVLAIWFVLFEAFHARFVSRASYRLGAVKGEALSRQNVVATESLNGIRELRLYNAASRAAGEYRAAADQLAEAMRSALVLRALPAHVLPALLAASGAVGLAIAEAAQPGAALTILPAVATFAFAALRLMPVIGRLAQSAAMVHESLPQVEVVALEIASPPEQAGAGTAPVPTSLAAIQLDRVGVCHRNGAAALSDITVAAEHGQVIAIAGPSGAGKSTLLDVLSGIRRPVSGKVVAVDGGGAMTPLDTVDPAGWSAMVGIVSQEQSLFHGTIEENIRFGRSLSDADVRRAARLAAIDTFVDTLPEGYRTIVGHRGLLLSGGQRQRILIARALANAPTLLLFDEATSALDSATEQQIQDTVRGLAEDRIVVQVAHRPAIIQAADRVWAIDAGRIVNAVP
jgi:ABC-type multidrug transport system fused ATPase/permease subunit